MLSHRNIALTAFAIASLSDVHPAAVRAGTEGRESILRAYANLPLAFVENRGQTDGRVHYYAHGPGYAFQFTRDAAVLSLTEGTRGIALLLRFLDANPKGTLSADQRAPGEVNYFRGDDPSRWRTAIPRYSRVLYHDLWPGVDMSVRGESGTLKYEFRVRPGHRVADIQLGYSGATGLSLDRHGALLVRTPLGVLRDSPPVAYQDIDGARVQVDSRYVVQSSGTAYGFAVTAYQRDQELIIDPGLEYSTFLGGSSHESAAGVAVDASGNAYITGITQSPNFPTTSGAFDRTGAASNSLEAFVTKLNSTGTALVYSTFLGGSNFEWGRAIAVDSAGNAYIAGQTKSSDFPTTSNAFDRTFNVDTCPRCGIDQYDAFVTKLNPAGSGLVYSTFLGGFDLDDALAIAVDGAGNAYVGGETGSSNFPVTGGAFDTTRNGAFDAFVTKLNAAGSALVYSTYLGGLEVEFIEGTVVNTSGEAHVTGSTRSANFPTTNGAFDTTHNGLFDVFVTRLNAAGSALVYSTFLGGADFDSAGGIAIDGGGNAYVAGGTASLDYPTTAGAFDRNADGSEAFVTKLSPGGTALVYSTLLGGSGDDGASDVVVDASGSAWIAGATSSADFPTTAGTAFDTTINGGTDTFLAQLDGGGSAVLHGTFLGGADTDSASDIAFDPGGNIIVVGQTMSPDFPTTAGAFDRVWNGDALIFWADAFVAKFAIGSPLPPSPAPSPAAPTLISPEDAATPAQPVTLDWTDVTNGTSYEVQVDTTSTLAAPFVANPIVSISQVTLSDLPSQLLWWRVRARNADGVFGPFSTTRRFTPRGATSGVEATTLTVTATGRSGERVTSSPAGINVSVGSTGSASFPVGTSITLSVTNGRDAIWSGACSSGGNKTRACTFTLNATAAVSANVQ